MNRFGTHFGRHFGRHFGIFDTVPPVPPKPPRRSGGFGPAGGGGGGGTWDREIYRFCDDVDDDGRVRRVDCDDKVTEELGDSESPAGSIAGFFGAGAAGFVGSKAVTKAVERRFGRHAGAAAAVLSVVASAKAGDKLAEKHPRFKRLGTMVFGSVIAAVDDLVDIYVNERGLKPEVKQIPDAWTFVARAQESNHLVVTRRLGTRRPNDERVLVLRYVSLQEKEYPPKMYVYQEVVEASPEGQFYVRGTLLEIIRKAKRATLVRPGAPT